MILAVDPGVRGCGVALYVGRVLVKAAYVKSTMARGLDVLAARTMGDDLFIWGSKASIMGTARLVIEVPRVYQAAQQKGDQNDLIALAMVIGAIGSHFPIERQYFPRDWKGTIDGDELIDKWIKPRLSQTERGAVTLPTAKGLAHNVYDAIGIGLKYFGRLEPNRVFSKEP